MCPSEWRKELDWLTLGVDIQRINVAIAKQVMSRQWVTLAMASASCVVRPSVGSLVPSLSAALPSRDAPVSSVRPHTYRAAYALLELALDSLMIRSSSMLSVLARTVITRRRLMPTTASATTAIAAIPMRTAAA